MFRTIRPLVASAVCTVSLLALSASALAMPAVDHHTVAFEPDAPTQSVAAHGSSISPAVWVFCGVLAVAIVATTIALVTTRRHSRPATVGS